MKRILTAIFALSLVCVSCIRERKSEPNDLQPGDSLPIFSVMMSDGTTLGTEDLRGSVSLIVFFNVICPDCAQTLPQVQKIYDDYASKGLKVVAISRNQGEDMVGVYWQNREYTMPYSAQEGSRVYELFAPNRIPRVYISDGNLTIRYLFTDEVFHRAAEDEFIYNSLAEAINSLI